MNIGNTYDNLNNGGFVVSADKCLFGSTEKGIIKESIVGGKAKVTFLNNDYVEYLNIFKENLYFSVCSGLKDSKKSKICKTDMNGKLIKQTEEDMKVSFLVVIDDEVYFTDELDNNSLYKMNTDFNKKQKVCEGPMYDISIYNDNIYYTKTDNVLKQDNKKMYSYNTKKKNEIELSDAKCSAMYSDGENIYYLIAGMNYGIYKADLNGENSKRIVNDLTSHICFYNDEIIYVSSLINIIHRVNKEGKKNLKITGSMDFGNNKLNIAGDFIYYKTNSIGDDIPSELNKIDFKGNYIRL